MTTTTSDGIREHELRDALDIHDAEVMHIDRTWVTITMRTADLDRLTQRDRHEHICDHDDCYDDDEIIHARGEATEKALDDAIRIVEEEAEAVEGPAAERFATAIRELQIHKGKVAA